ncbi:MAG: NUDIX hydrolase [Candidatus Neomarinimicrobiota bacterium]
MKDLTETRVSSTHIFKGKLLDVWSDTVKLPNGDTSEREYIKHPGAVVMVPVLPDDKILLIRQFRYPLAEVEIELPAGKIDPGESLLETVDRELAEETGYTAGKVTQLAEIHPCIGYSSERMWIFLAENLKETSAKRDYDEFIELLPTEFSLCLEWIRSGKIKDIKTIIGIFWAEKVRSRRWTLTPANPI